MIGGSRRGGQAGVAGPPPFAGPHLCETGPPAPRQTATTMCQCVSTGNTFDLAVRHSLKKHDIIATKTGRGGGGERRGERGNWSGGGLQLACPAPAWAIACFSRMACDYCCGNSYDTMGFTGARLLCWTTGLRLLGSGLACQAKDSLAWPFHFSNP